MQFGFDSRSKIILALVVVLAFSAFFSRKQSVENMTTQERAEHRRKQLEFKEQKQHARVQKVELKQQKMQAHIQKRVDKLQTKIQKMQARLPSPAPTQAGMPIPTCAPCPVCPSLAPPPPPAASVTFIPTQFPVTAPIVPTAAVPTIYPTEEGAREVDLEEFV